jgi:hypothetical protein
MKEQKMFFVCIILKKVKKSRYVLHKFRKINFIPRLYNAYFNFHVAHPYAWKVGLNGPILI